MTGNWWYSKLFIASYKNFWEDQSFDLIIMKVVTECAQCKALLFAKGYYTEDGTIQYAVNY